MARTPRNRVVEEQEGDDAGRPVSPVIRTDRADAITRQLFEEAKREFQHSGVLLATDDIQPIIGIPFPGFCLEYLMQYDVLPLSTMFQIVGTQMSCKSAFTYEVLRWFAAHQGAGILLENETKFSPILFRAINRYVNNRLMMQPCNSVEEWQKACLHHLAKLEAMADEVDPETGRPFGRCTPMCLAIDSVMGKATLETQQRIDETGHSGRAFPAEALSIAGYTRILASKLAHAPVCVIGTLHLKPQKDAQGHTIDHTPGGRALNFHETFRLKMSAIGKVSSAFLQGRLLKMKCTKNSLGDDNLSIDTRFLWSHEDYTDPATGETTRRKKMWWDWGWSTIKLLTTQEYRERKDAIRDITGIVTVSSGQTTAQAHSSKLGVPRTSPVSWSELGDLIHADPIMMTQLRTLFGIGHGRVFDLAVDYRKQLGAKVPRARRARDDEE